MVNRSAVGSRVAARFHLLVDQLASEAGRPQRGWQASVARRLGLSKSFLTRFLNGDLAVGTAAIDRACQTLGLDSNFFTASKGYPKPNYKRFLIARQGRLTLRDDRPSVSWQDLARAGEDLAKRMNTGNTSIMEIHDFAQKLMRSPVVIAAARIAQLNPTHRANGAVILRVGQELARALVEGRDSQRRPTSAKRVAS